MKQVAIIDMGTNTFHLMLATINQTGFKIKSREKVPVKIGMGGINQGYITDEGIERAIAAMKGFGKTIHDAGIETALAFGTSALRNARNGEQAIQDYKRAARSRIYLQGGEVSD